MQGCNSWPRCTGWQRYILLKAEVTWPQVQNDRRRLPSVGKDAHRGIAWFPFLGLWSARIGNSIEAEEKAAGISWSRPHKGHASVFLSLNKVSRAFVPLAAITERNCAWGIPLEGLWQQAGLQSWNRQQAPEDVDAKKKLCWNCRKSLQSSEDRSYIDGNLVMIKH